MIKTKLKDIEPIKAWANLSEDEPQKIFEVHWYKDQCRQDLRIIRVLVTPILPKQP